MKICGMCGKELRNEQKKTCSINCRGKYLATLNKGKVSPFKGMKNRWTDEQRKAIGNSQRNIPKSKEFKKLASERMKGKPSFWKGKKHTEETKALISNKNKGDKHYNYKGKNSTGKNRGQYSVNLRREKIGFTQELFNSRLEYQNNKCAICEVEFDEEVYMKKKSADHCHTRNIPRGILCRRCNIMIGQVNDDTNILKMAIEYINMWKRTA